MHFLTVSQPPIVVANPYPTNMSMGSRGIIVRNSPQTGSMFLPKTFTTVNRKKCDWSKMPVEQMRVHQAQTKRNGKAVFVAQEDFDTLDREVPEMFLNVFFKF